MLTSLIVRNFTLIEQLELSFTAGLTVLTGETGAGKSMLLDALDMVLGSRSDATVVRPGAALAEIIATFSLANQPEAIDWLRQHDLAVEEESIVRRVISSDGRSKAYINDTPTTLQSLKAFTSTVMTIHSQHQHLAITEKDKQRELVDQYAGLESMATDVADLFRQIASIEKQLMQLESKANNREAEMEFLQFQLEEIESLAVDSSDGLVQLEDEQRQLIKTQASVEKIQYILQLCDDDHPNLLEQMSVMNQYTQKLDGEQFSDAKTLAESALIQLQEAVGELRHIADGIDLNAERLIEIEQQLDKIYHTARKHQVNPSDLFSVKEKLIIQLSELENLSEQIKLLQTDLHTAKNAYHTMAKELSQQRQKVAKKLSLAITKMIQPLGMAKAEFKVSVESDETQLKASGIDDIEFLLQSNPGHPFAPMRKIASGGELSRLSLALSVMTQSKNTHQPTLVYDEVDVGIGGETANRVGELLKQMAKQHQILCITHLPQVAAFGDQHVSVEKTVKKGETIATIKSLNRAERIQELARMLGDQQSETLQGHAKALLENQNKAAAVLL